MPPPLTDRRALAAHRNRTTPDALFLHRIACEEVQDRLTVVNRSFKDVAIVTPFPVIWKEAYPEAHIIADDEVLDLTDQSYDLLIHGLCLHWANDPVGQLIQCQRALRPDGALMAVTLGGQTLQELRVALSSAEVAVTGGLSPRILPMGEIRDLGALLQRAGFALPVADSLPMIASYATPLHLMHDLRAMAENNALAQRLRHPTRRAVILRAAELYAQEHGDAEGRVPATYDIIFLHGWAPDASQPKPLRPGSATTRLADALGTKETPLKD